MNSKKLEEENRATLNFIEFLTQETNKKLAENNESLIDEKDDTDNEIKQKIQNIEEQINEQYEAIKKVILKFNRSGEKWYKVEEV